MKKGSTDQAGLPVLKPKQNQAMRSILIALVYLISFILLDFITKQFEVLPGIVTWYPPAGLTYALLLVFGARFTPAVILALFLSSVFVYRMPQSPSLLLLWAVVISLIYAATAWFLRHRIHLDWQLRKLRDMRWLIGVVVLVSALLAILSVSSSALSSDMQGSEVLRAIFRWWIGESVGVLTITPFLLLYVMPWLKRFVDGQPVRVPRHFLFPSPALTFIGQAASLVLILYWVFGSRVLDEFRPMYIMTLPLIWIALEHGLKKLTGAIMALNFGVVLSTWLFGFDLARLGELELLMIVICVVGLLIGAVVDERKMAGEELRSSEKRYRSLFENAPIGVYRTTPEGRIQMANPALVIMLGYDTFEELVQRDLIKEGYEESISRKNFQQLIEQEGILSNHESAWVKKDGSTILVRENAYLGRDESNQSLYYEGIVQDITERKQAEEQIKNQVEILAALYDLSRKLGGMDDFNDILNLVTRSAVETIHITFACFLLLEHDDLVLRAAYPIRSLEHEIKMDQRLPRADCPFCQRFLDGNVPLVLENAGPEADEFVNYFLGFAQSLCFIPIHFQEQPFGILLLGEARDKTRAPFSAEKMHLADSIADQAASALHRTLLSEQARHRLQRIACLREIDNTIAASFDLRLSLEVILKHVFEQLKVDAAAVLVVNSSLQRLEYQGGRGFRSQALDLTHQRLDEGQAGLAIRERRMVQIPDVAASGAFFAQSEFMKAERFCVYIALPLIVKGKAKGVLEIFHRSPLDPDEEWFEFLNSLAGQTAIAIDNDQLFYGLQRSNIELGLAYDATIEGWSHALDLRDKETEGHSMRVSRMTVELARSFNIPDNELKQVRWGALLHDIGKMGVPDSILLKPGPLTDEEWVIMKKHPEFSLEMLSPIQYLKHALDIPYYHHEKWDGSGYPRGLKGEQIPLAARLFAVVDVYDALTSDRPYRKAWTKENALKHIWEQTGKHFDPQVVDAFFRLEKS